MYVYKCVCTCICTVCTPYQEHGGECYLQVTHSDLTMFMWQNTPACICCARKCRPCGVNLPDFIFTIPRQHTFSRYSLFWTTVGRCAENAVALCFNSKSLHFLCLSPGDLKNGYFALFCRHCRCAPNLYLAQRYYHRA